MSKLSADPAVKTGFLNNISKSTGSCSSSGSAVPALAGGPCKLIREVTAQTSGLPSCNCEGIKKYYVFKDECAKFIFCEGCVKRTSKVNLFLRHNNNSDTPAYPPNFQYSCCGDQIQDNIIYKLYTVLDAEKYQFSPVACKNCRVFWVGRVHIESEHSVKMTFFKNNQLCRVLNSKGNLCLTSASYNFETQQPRCAQHKGFLKLL